MNFASHPNKELFDTDYESFIYLNPSACGEKATPQPAESDIQTANNTFESADRVLRMDCISSRMRSGELIPVI
jgi:hypothetical protein